MRLFVALDLDDDARRAMAALRERVVRALGRERSVKTVDPAHMHLTLAFLGEIAEPAVAPIADALSASIDMRPFAATFHGLGVFPLRGAPRVLWLGLMEGAEQVVEVQRLVADRLEGLGVPVERRTFHPHLTLARWRDSRPADRERALAADPRAPIAQTAVDHVTLYQSRLSPAGPTYRALARATLT